MATAQGHAQLVKTFLGTAKIVKKVPSLVWVEFNDNLIEFPEESDNVLSVVNSQNKRVDFGGTIVGGARISTKLKQNIRPGRYVVNYRVVSEDGHPVRGSFAFIYKP
jgi:methionine-rich copper-binding protein CopC